MSYDIEDILNQTETTLKSDLNTTISSINTDKGDAITLRSVDANAYAFQSLNNKVYNFDPFILYGVTDISTESNGPYTQNTYTVGVYLLLADNAEGVEVDKKMFRYQKALKDTMENNWQNGGIKNKITVESLLPTMIEKLNGSEDFKVVGIEFKTTVA